MTGARVVADRVVYPTCDTCEKPAIWSESLGWAHFENGATVPPNHDTSGHAVTVAKWREAEERRHARDWFQIE